MDDLKRIKRHYGEKMMHLCRELFPTLLETPGLLFGIISSKFSYSKILYNDLIEKDMIEEFKELVYGLYNNKEDYKQRINKTPAELLDEAGYILYECKTEKDIQSFKKYYAKGEELCTFNGGRLSKCYVFFAVKKDVENIKRENFEFPARQDEYGTSVISIQFAKGRINTLSIKNRYNHTVDWPDSTFGNNLDNIIPGLSDAFARKYRLNMSHQSNSIEFDGYVLANDGKYYKYDFENDNIYYCPNNIIIDNFKPIEYDKSRYIVFENFILDMQEKRIVENKYEDKYKDSFLDGLQDIKKIKIKKNKEQAQKTIIINDDIIIVLNNNNSIISYTNKHIKKIGLYFLENAKNIKHIDLPNVVKIDDYFLHQNVAIRTINLPKVEEIGDYFLYLAENIKKVNLPNLKHIGHSFLINAVSLEELNLPKVETIENYFLQYNKKLEKLNLPNVEKIGSYFMPNNLCLERLSLPNVKNIENNFLTSSMNDIGNTMLKEINLPNVEEIGDDFLSENYALKKISLPNVEKIGNDFLRENDILNELSLPKVKQIGKRFMVQNTALKLLYLPEIISIDQDFLSCNFSLEKVYMPKLQLCFGGLFLIRLGSMLNKEENKNLEVYIPEFEFYCNEKEKQKVKEK